MKLSGSSYGKPMLQEQIHNNIRSKCYYYRELIVETRQGSGCSLDATAKRELGSGDPVYIVPCQQLLGYSWQPIKFSVALHCLMKVQERGERALLMKGKGWNIPPS